MKTIGIGLVLLLGGCAGLESPNPASPYYVYSSGWTVQLNQPLTIPPDAATVRLQYGRIVPRNSVQEHDPFCVVELATVRAEPQTLQPGRFEVWRVTRSVSTIAAAASPLIKAAYVDDDGDPTFLYYITEFRLRDAAQPNLRGMTCAWNQMAPGNRGLMRHLTLDEIRHALGGWMTLIPPKERI
ncbi:MAG TPA: hypothetical protein VN283_04765 [Thiobacillus sp.]|nr:hypothetical protein [Thiobacillus sp.]